MKYNFAFLLLFIAGISNAQSLKSGISLTYVHDSEIDLQEIGLHVLTTNVNLAYEVSPMLNIGLQYRDILSLGSAYNFSDEKNRYYTTGLLLQLDLLPNMETELFPELSINYGNICTCGHLDPFEQAGIVYLGYGFGLDFPLTKRLFLDTGLHWYRPITEIQQYDKVWAGGGYILGLSYKLL